jgi:hypothetical protein
MRAAGTPGYDDERPLPTASEDPMDYGFASHIMLWVVGAIAAIGLVGTVLAFWSMSRAAYRDK